MLHHVRPDNTGLGGVHPHLCLQLLLHSGGTQKLNELSGSLTGLAAFDEGYTLDLSEHATGQAQAAGGWLSGFVFGVEQFGSRAGGIAHDQRVFTAAAAEVGTLVVVDEAYQPFSSRTYLDVIRKEPDQHAHVLLMRTMSNFGLAGVRIGYMLGNAALIAQIDKVRPPYNVSVLNYECALFALEHADVFASQAVDIRTQRSLLQKAFRAMPGLHAWPSDANMILVRLDGGADRAQSVFDAMKSSGILVKNVSKMHPLLANCLRITVGTADENQQLLAALKDIL